MPVAVRSRIDVEGINFGLITIVIIGSHRVVISTKKLELLIEKRLSSFSSTFFIHFAGVHQETGFAGEQLPSLGR